MSKTQVSIYPGEKLALWERKHLDPKQAVSQAIERLSREMPKVKYLLRFGIIEPACVDDTRWQVKKLPGDGGEIRDIIRLSVTTEGFQQEIDVYLFESGKLDLAGEKLKKALCGKLGKSQAIPQKNEVGRISGGKVKHCRLRHARVRSLSRETTSFLTPPEFTRVGVFCVLVDWSHAVDHTPRLRTRRADPNAQSPRRSRSCSW